MSKIRAEMVKKAKSMGICTQCLKLKRLRNYMQCQRCIDTNKRKRERRKSLYAELQANSYDYKQLCKSTNPLRKKIQDYAVKHKICSKCFGRPAEEDLKQCSICLERKRMYSIKTRAKKVKPLGRPPKSKVEDKVKIKPTQEQIDARREALKRHKKKKLYNKVRNLDRIKHAMEKES